MIINGDKEINTFVSHESNITPNDRAQWHWSMRRARSLASRDGERYVVRARMWPGQGWRYYAVRVNSIADRNLRTWRERGAAGSWAAP